MPHDRNPPPDYAGSDDATQVVGSQQPPPRYIASDHVPQPRPPVQPPLRRPPPPIPYAPPPSQYRPAPRRNPSRLGLIVGAVAAVVSLTAALIGLAVMSPGHSDDAATNTPPSARPPSDGPDGPPIEFWFDGERRDIGNQVTCTEHMGNRNVTLGTDENTINMTLGSGPDWPVRNVGFTIDGTAWTFDDTAGPGTAAAYSRDGKSFSMNGAAHDPNAVARGDLRNFRMRFVCP